MKLIFSYIFYLIGDLISRTTMQWLNGFGYSIYKTFMLWSCDLDINGKIWKHVKDQNSNNIEIK